MLEFSINSGEIDLLDKSLVAVLGLLCSLEYSKVLTALYAGAEASRENLSDNESILTLALAISSTAEALNAYHKFIFEGVIKFDPNWPIRVRQSFEFLGSTEVENFKVKHLKKVRNKAGFHIDPVAVKGYINKKRESSDAVISLLKTDSNGAKGYSPMAAEVVASYLIDRIFDSYDSAKMFSRVSDAITNVATQYIADKCQVTVIEQRR